MLGKVSVQLRVEHRKSLPDRSGMKGGAVEWPRLARRLCLPPTLTGLSTTYPGPTFQGLGGWAVGTQMLRQVANAGETEAAARAGAGYLFP